LNPGQLPRIYSNDIEILVQDIKYNVSPGFFFWNHKYTFPFLAKPVFQNVIKIMSTRNASGLYKILYHAIYEYTFGQRQTRPYIEMGLKKFDLAGGFRQRLTIEKNTMSVLDAFMYSLEMNKLYPRDHLSQNAPRRNILKDVHDRMLGTLGILVHKGVINLENSKKPFHVIAGYIPHTLVMTKKRDGFALKINGLISILNKLSKKVNSNGRKMYDINSKYKGSYYEEETPLEKMVRVYELMYPDMQWNFGAGFGPRFRVQYSLHNNQRKYKTHSRVPSRKRFEEIVRIFEKFGATAVSIHNPPRRLKKGIKAMAKCWTDGHRCGNLQKVRRGNGSHIPVYANTERLNRSLSQHFRNAAMRTPKIPKEIKTDTIYRGIQSEELKSKLLTQGYLDDKGYIAFSPKRNVAYGAAGKQPSSSFVLELPIKNIENNTPLLWFQLQKEGKKHQFNTYFPMVEEVLLPPGRVYIQQPQNKPYNMNSYNIKVRFEPDRNAKSLGGKSIIQQRKNKQPAAKRQKTR
jgi:hypothetical protein